MDDLISRQEAIDICNNAIDLWHGQLGEGIVIAVKKKIEELPSAQPDSKELSFTHKALDTISRQDAIRIVDGIDTWQAGWRGDAIESMKALPSAQPEHTNSCYTNSWCIDCKEYDTENKCCPRYNRVIKQTLDDAYRHGETEAEARFYAEIVRCKDCKHQVKEWRDDKRLKDKGYWVCGCDVVGDACGYWALLGQDDDYCSMAERRTDDKTNKGSSC